MEDKKNGYKSKHYDFPTKRYCQTLDLKDDPELIKEYKKRHGQECYWPEIGEGLKVSESWRWKFICAGTVCS